MDAEGAVTTEVVSVEDVGVWCGAVDEGPFSYRWRPAYS